MPQPKKEGEVQKPKTRKTPEKQENGGPPVLEQVDAPQPGPPPAQNETPQEEPDGILITIHPEGRQIRALGQIKAEMLQTIMEQAIGDVRKQLQLPPLG